MQNLLSHYFEKLGLYEDEKAFWGALNAIFEGLNEEEKKVMEDIISKNT